MASPAKPFGWAEDLLGPVEGARESGEVVLVDDLAGADEPRDPSARLLVEVRGRSAALALRLVVTAIAELHSSGYEGIAQRGGVTMQTVKFVHWEDEGAWIGYLQDYPDYWTQGETLDDLRDHLQGLYRDLTSEELPGIRKVGEFVVS